jgi:hypothetical protein
MTKKVIVRLVFFILSYELCQLFCSTFIFQYNSSFFGIKSAWAKAWDIKVMMVMALGVLPLVYLFSQKWKHLHHVLFAILCLLFCLGVFVLSNWPYSMKTEYSGWDRLGASYIVNKMATHYFNYMLFLTAALLISLHASNALKRFVLYFIPVLIYLIILIVMAQIAPPFTG